MRSYATELEMISEDFLTHGWTILHVMKVKQVRGDSQGPANPECFSLPEQAGFVFSIKTMQKRKAQEKLCKRPRFT